MAVRSLRPHACVIEPPQLHKAMQQLDVGRESDNEVLEVGEPDGEFDDEVLKVGKPDVNGKGTSAEFDGESDDGVLEVGKGVSAQFDNESDDEVLEAFLTKRFNGPDQRKPDVGLMSKPAASSARCPL